MTRFRDYPAPPPDMHPVTDATIRRFGRWAVTIAASAVGLMVGLAYIADQMERQIEMTEVSR